MTIDELRELYRGAIEDEDGWPVSTHDAYVRLGARFEKVLPVLIDIAEIVEKKRPHRAAWIGFDARSRLTGVRFSVDEIAELMFAFGRLDEIRSE